MRYIGASADPLLSTDQWASWDNRRDAFARDVHLNGNLLPKSKYLGDKLTKISGQLGRVIYDEFDEYGNAIQLEPGDQADLNAVIAASEDLISDLQAFRRGSAEADKPRFQWRRWRRSNT